MNACIPNASATHNSRNEINKAIRVLAACNRAPASRIFVACCGTLFAMLARARLPEMSDGIAEFFFYVYQLVLAYFSCKRTVRPENNLGDSFSIRFTAISK